MCPPVTGQCVLREKPLSANRATNTYQGSRREFLQVVVRVRKVLLRLPAIRTGEARQKVAFSARHRLQTLGAGLGLHAQPRTREKLPLTGQSHVSGKDLRQDTRIPIFESVIMVTAGGDSSVHINHWPDWAIPTPMRQG